MYTLHVCKSKCTHCMTIYRSVHTACLYIEVYTLHVCISKCTHCMSVYRSVHNDVYVSISVCAYLSFNPSHSCPLYSIQEKSLYHIPFEKCLAGNVTAKSIYLAECDPSDEAQRFDFTKRRTDKHFPIWATGGALVGEGDVEHIGPQSPHLLNVATCWHVA